MLQRFVTNQKTNVGRCDTKFATLIFGNCGYAMHRRSKRGGGGAGPLNNLRGGGGNIPFGPLNNPPTFSFNFYVKQEKMTNVPSLRVK